jgi:hypothetical protein
MNSTITYSQNLTYGTILVSNYGAIPDDGLDDTQAIRSAINAAIATNSPQIILFNAGRYDLKNAATNNYHVRLMNANNIIFRGATVNNQPATRLVRFNNGVEDVVLPFLFQILSSKNISVENFIFDNDPYYYTAGVVTAKSGNDVTVDIFPGHPMNILKPYIMGTYDPVTGANKKLRVTWETGLPTWASEPGGSGRLLKVTYADLASAVNVGDNVFWFQGNHGGTQCVTSKSENISFKNVITHNATGFVYHFVDNENVTLNKVKIETTGNRIAVAPRDGIHLANNRGLILLDSVVVKNVPGDDGLNAHGVYLSVGSISGKTITFNENIVADLKPNSRIQFVDANFQPAWTGTVESSSPVVANNTPVTVVLKETPPSWIIAGSIASPLGWIADALIIKNSVFENTGRFGALARINNVVIDSCTFRFNGNAGIAIGSNYNNFFQESQNAWNIVVKNNFFENNILRMGDNTGPGGVYVDQFFVDNPGANGNLFFSKNTFKDETYAYNLKDAKNIHLWGNVYNNVTTPIWRNLPTTSNFTQSIVYDNIVTDDSYKGAIYYSETWPVSSNASDTLGTVTWNNAANAFAEFHFVGNYIAYYARKGTQMGKVDVYLDDVLVLNDYDLYANTTINKFLVYSNSALSNTVHTLRIVNSGLSNTSAINTYVNIDYLLHRMGNYIASSAPNSVLPITLLDFYGKPDANQVLLSWQTTNEINNSHFEVLKLDKDNNFNSIGRLEAKKTPGILNNYSFADLKPKNGNNYYQLMQYDIDGKSTPSKIIQVNFSLQSALSVYPNPVKAGSIVNVLLLSDDAELEFQLIDMQQRVVQQKIFSNDGKQLTLSTVGLMPGLYVMKLKSKTNQYMGKIIVSQ